MTSVVAHIQDIYILLLSRILLQTQPPADEVLPKVRLN